MHKENNKTKNNETKFFLLNLKSNSHFFVYGDNFEFKVNYKFIQRTLQTIFLKLVPKVQQL